MSKATGPTQATKGLTTKHVILILGALVIVAAAVVTVVLLTRPSADAKTEGVAPIGNLVVDESNLQDIKRELGEKVERGMFETHMNTTWIFPDGNSASRNAVMGNSVNNNFPFWFDVALAGSNDVVFTSSLLPVGSQLEEIKLSEPLEKGEYSAIVSVHMVDDDGEPVESNMGFSITLVVEN